jgi:predicted nucleic acid-binding Zn ribbon protein
MSSGPQPIGAALQNLFRQLGITKKMQGYDVMTTWGEVVGEKIARVTAPRKVVNGVLFVEVTTGSWRTELSMRKLEILEKVHRRAGRKILKDIRFH